MASQEVKSQTHSANGALEAELGLPLVAKGKGAASLGTSKTSGTAVTRKLTLAGRPAAIHQLRNADLDEYISSPDQRASIELRCSLVLNYLKGCFDGFALSTEGIQVLGTVLALNGYTFKNIARLVDKANGFITHMRKDTSFWLEYPLFDPSQFEQMTYEQDQGFLQFQQKVLRLPLISRAHFFDLSGYNRSTRQFKFESFDLHGVLRRIVNWGLDIQESSSQLLKLGLVTLVDDPVRLLLTKSKTDLIQMLTVHKVPYKKS